MIVINNSALRMYPQRTSSYVYSIKEEKKFKKKKHKKRSAVILKSAAAQM